MPCWQPKSPGNSAEHYVSSVSTCRPTAQERQRTHFPRRTFRVIPAASVSSLRRTADPACLHLRPFVLFTAPYQNPEALRQSSKLPELPCSPRPRPRLCAVRFDCEGRRRFARLHVKASSFPGRDFLLRFRRREIPERTPSHGSYSAGSLWSFTVMRSQPEMLNRVRATSNTVVAYLRLRTPAFVLTCAAPTRQSDVQVRSSYEKRKKKGLSRMNCYRAGCVYWETSQLLWSGYHSLY